jgi:hypothetical protein
MIADDELIEHLGDAIGSIRLHPAKPGSLALRLTAESDWGQTTLTRRLQVVVPTPHILLLRPAVQIGYPGQEVCFEWRSAGAESLWLVSPDGAVPQRLRDTEGFLFVRIGTRPAEFQLIARGYGDTEHTVRLAAVPDPLGCLEQSPPEVP